MGKVIATCGHELTEAEGLGKDVMSLTFDTFGNRAVEYSAVCDAYAPNYLPANEELADEWLRGDSHE